MLPFFQFPFSPTVLLMLSSLPFLRLHVPGSLSGVLCFETTAIGVWMVFTGRRRGLLMQCSLLPVFTSL